MKTFFKLLGRVYRLCVRLVFARCESRTDEMGGDKLKIK